MEIGVCRLVNTGDGATQGDKTTGTRTPQDPGTGPQLKSDRRTHSFHSENPFLREVAANYCAV
jgi:hypothetical protein